MSLRDESRLPPEGPGLSRCRFSSVGDAERPVQKSLRLGKLHGFLAFSGVSHLLVNETKGSEPLYIVDVDEKGGEGTRILLPTSI